MMYKSIKRCPICKEIHILEVEKERIMDYASGRKLIQEAFPDPDYDKFEREFIKSGYCPKCQEMLFGAVYEGDRIVKEQ